MLILITILTTGYLIFLLWEKKSNDRALASFRHVIHVNGIRGKTGTCRLIDAHLRGAGYRVFTKTTGTAPCWIDTEGKEHAIRRWGNANISEQLRMIRKAWKEKADILIIECMAVQPELQKAAQEQMIKGKLNVITNVRYDHVFEMGDTLEDIAESLAATIPDHGTLFTSDETFYPYFVQKAKEKNTNVVLCKSETPGTAENEAIAMAVGEALGIPRETFSCHVPQYKEDFGAQKMYGDEDGRFLNLFSVNDPQSTKNILQSYFADTSDVVFLYNNRADRPDRLLLFARYFFPDIPYRKIIVMGEARPLAIRQLKRYGLDHVYGAENWQKAMALSAGAPVVGIGNIKGQGCAMIAYFEGGNKQ